MPFSSVLHRRLGLMTKKLIEASRKDTLWVRQTPTPAAHRIQMCLWKRTGRQSVEKLSGRPRPSWKKQRENVTQYRKS
uniref:Calcium voltage-gated channel auxiliary subunit beta 2 n=1 Tax=Rattus norvegicus TaxID=10116 RepID=A0A8I6A4H7_RAT